MVKEKIILVDKTDNIIGSKERGTLDQDDIYRISALWIKNTKEEFLLAQRKLTKKNDPGKWGPAVAGTNDVGETYESNILKEAKEEIGLEKFNFSKSKKIRKQGHHNYFCQWFVAIVDKNISDFKIQEEEVEQIRWISKQELIEDLSKNPSRYVPSMKDVLDL